MARKPPPHRTFDWDKQSELELLAQFCRSHFWTFFLHGFGAGANPKGQRWIDPRVHEPLADWFQHHIDEWLEKRSKGRGEQKHLAILVHREVGKTTMITQAGQAWLHVRDPEISSYTGAESLKLASSMLDSIKAVFDGTDPYALFTKLYGNWSTQARTWTAKEIVHAARKNIARKDASLSTFAVETSIVGAHPDAIFYDDPISYERIMSDTNWLKAVNSQVTSLFPVIQSDGLIVWVGTRYDDDDHFGVAFREEGVASLSGMETDSIPVSEDGKWHVYFLCGRDQDQKPTTPRVWPERRLVDFQRRDPLRYAAQVMNDPAVSEFNPITKEQIRQCVVPKEKVPWAALRYAINCDTAFQYGDRRVRKDETVFIVHGFAKDGSGDVYVVEVHGSPIWRAEDFAHRLVAKVQQYRRQGRRVFAITDERNNSKADAWRLALQSFFNDAGEPMPQFYEIDRWSGPKKTKRMHDAATFWVDGHVKVVEGGPGVEKLMDQMAKIGQYMVNSKLKDDYADAHADAFRPELYVPMRRVAKQKAPWEKGAQSIYVEGLDTRDFDDSEDSEWIRNVPREPLKGY